MKRLLLLFSFYIKAAIKKLPLIFAGTLIFIVTAALLCTGFIALTGTDNDSTQKASIYIVSDDDSPYVKMAVGYISSIETIKKICSLKITDENKAVTALKNGKADAVVYLPSGFFSSVINGDNIPARIILNSEEVNSQSEIIRSIINAGASDLAAAQAGIYATERLALALGISGNDYDEVNNHINSRYISFALSRNELYDIINISATGSLSTTEFYMCSGIVLVLLFSGISCFAILMPERSLILDVLSSRHVFSGFPYIFKVLGCSFIYTFFCCLFLAVTGKIHNITGILSIFLITICAFSFSGMVYRLCKNEASAMLYIFLASVIMLFMAGGFIPDAFLPNEITRIGNILPGGVMLDAMKCVFLGGNYNFTGCMAYSVLFIICGCIAERRCKFNGGNV